ncbi:uncharacterized protein LOC121975097 [Zingiber officinale]|uniref:uncharacterized protein LOC121975097 n=1 Tax=Zingiber officinale TaxID=94328 RepID=UPI001C4CEDF1|nr:uncharacterized protein LOC121975097 [Zingiber officinale]
MIKQIPKYAKFLKDLCVHKKKLKGNELISMGKNVSALLQPAPQKCEDPGVFTIPCEIGSSLFKDAMLDLGASINMMPKSVFQTLGIEPLQPTGVVLQLADHSQTHLAGVIEDVLVKFLLKKPDAKPRLIIWTLLLQEFDLEIRDRSEKENLVADHLSRIEGDLDHMAIDDDFRDEQLFRVHGESPWYADLVNFLVCNVFPAQFSKAQKDKLKSDLKYYVWDDPYLGKFCSNQIIRRCIPDFEFQTVLAFCHSSEFGGGILDLRELLGKF